MSAASTAPDPDDRRDEMDGVDGVPADGGLTDRDRRVLDEIAGFERGADPTFTARLRGPARRASPTTEGVLQVLAVTVLAAVLLPTAWLMVGVIVLVLVGVPGLMAWYGHRATPPGRQPPED